MDASSPGANASEMCDRCLNLFVSTTPSALSSPSSAPSRRTARNRGLASPRLETHSSRSSMNLSGNWWKSTRMDCSTFRDWNSSSETSMLWKKKGSESLVTWTRSTCGA